MLVKVGSVASVGLDTVPVEVEVDVAENGFPGLSIVGLAGKAVEEAKERVKTAITNSGFDFPPKKITINLAPADLPKEGAAYDLPMAVGILAASQQISNDESQISNKLFYGEVGLDGGLRATKGVLLVGLYAAKYSNNTNTTNSTNKEVQIFVPVESANEAAVVDGVTTYPVRTLQELLDHLNGVKEMTPLKHIEVENLVEDAAVEFDLAEVAGQEQAKRALVIAAAGGHNLFKSWFKWQPTASNEILFA